MFDFFFQNKEMLIYGLEYTSEEFILNLLWIDKKSGKRGRKFETSGELGKRNIHFIILVKTAVEVLF